MMLKKLKEGGCSLVIGSKTAPLLTVPAHVVTVRSFPGTGKQCGGGGGRGECFVPNRMKRTLALKAVRSGKYLKKVSKEKNKLKNKQLN